MSQYIIQGIFVVAGIIAMLAAILDWDWFFTAQNTQFVVRNVGRRQARWFYGMTPLMSGTPGTRKSGLVASAISAVQSNRKAAVAQSEATKAEQAKTRK